MAMESLVSATKGLKSSLGGRVGARMQEFAELGMKPSRELFKEMCFCLLTANFNAERAMAIQERIGDGFLTLPEPDLAARLKELGHRHPNARASYIAGARVHADGLKGILGSFAGGPEAREWLVRNVKGLGYKEASHFLRNIGYQDLAIIDFHIVDLLVSRGIIRSPGALSPARYVEIERILRELGARTNLTLGELDLYLWYQETGKILK